MGRRTEPGAYKEVQRLVEPVDSEGGRTWRRSDGHGGGGVRVLELRGKAVEVPVHGREKNGLDEPYVAGVDEPRTRDDYYHPGTLKKDAFWKLRSPSSRARVLGRVRRLPGT